MCFVVSTGAVGKGHRAAALQPSADFRNAAHVADETGAGQKWIVIHVIAFQRCQASLLAGDVDLRCPLCWQSDRRMFRHVDTVLGAHHTVPDEIIVHGIPP